MRSTAPDPKAPDLAALDDDRLTEAGATLDLAEPRVALIACGALAREILALGRMNGWTGFALRCLPAKLHNHPEQIPDAVRAKVREARAEGFGAVFVVYADCGTGGLLDTVCAEEDVERVPGPHCYSFFEGNALFAARTEGGDIAAFYLTDFLARQFETLIWKGLGLDRHPDLLPLYFGNYERLVYLAQTDDLALDGRARAAAERLGLAYERRMTGYGDLAGVLSGALARA